MSQSTDSDGVNSDVSSPSSDTDTDTDDGSTTLSDITIPVSSVDPDADLESRLTDNTLYRLGPSRYFDKDDTGEPIEDWHGTFERVATNVAQPEKQYDSDFTYWQNEFESAMREQRFMPNSPTIMNAGTEIQQLSACFVNSPRDDMDDIGDKQSDAMDIFYSGGGLGYSFSFLRPKGAVVRTTGGRSSGPISFMELFDTTCGVIKQGGRRRGAQMAILHAQHPDIGRFINAKYEEDRFNNFNISVGVSDEFIEAKNNDEAYTLYDPEVGLRPGQQREPFTAVPESVHLYSPEYEDHGTKANPDSGIDGKVVSENIWRDYDIPGIDKYRDRVDVEVGEPLTLPAGLIWEIICYNAWRNGEPGLFYIDETNREHSFDVQEHPEHYIYATNPCGEQPLEEMEACNLGHVNLSLMVDDDRMLYDEWASEHISDYTQSESEIAKLYLDHALDHDEFNRTVRTGTRFLDNVVTMSEFPLEGISNSVKNKRKIGLGLMGFAQMLVQLGIPYGSDFSYAIAREIMRRIDKKSVSVSHELAQTRGNFNEWDESKYANPTAYPDWFEKHTHRDPSEYEDGFDIRNHNTTTIAPTGTTSMIGDTSGGCEPIYSVGYFKNVSEDVQGADALVEFDDFFLQTLQANDIDVDAVTAEVKELMNRDAFDGITSLDTVPDVLDDVFVTTQELTGEQHIRMQGAFQEYVDSGISKTLNMAHDVEPDEIGHAFDLALDLGIKGSTIYRDGSRDTQVNTTDASSTQESEDETEPDIDAVLSELDTETLKSELRHRMTDADDVSEFIKDLHAIQTEVSGADATESHDTTDSESDEQITVTGGENQ